MIMDKLRVFKDLKWLREEISFMIALMKRSSIVMRRVGKVSMKLSAYHEGIQPKVVTYMHLNMKCNGYYISYKRNHSFIYLIYIHRNKIYSLLFS